MRSRRAAAEAGEFAFLRRLLPTLAPGRGVVVGPGDDAAVIRGAARIFLTTDALVEGTHFLPGWMTPEEIGAKAVLVNLSDAAAMGGRPQHLLLSVGVPAGCDRRALERLHRGADAAARAAGAAIVGGNLSAADRLFVSVTLVGACPHPVLRSGAKPGDLLFVTGTLGDAAVAVDLLRRGVAGRGPGTRPLTAHAFLMRRFRRPTPRLATGAMLAKRGLVSAMIDLSDGLVQDLGHVCERSRVGAAIYAENLPRSKAYLAVAGSDPGPALGGGEDYELLFSVPRARLARFERVRARLPDAVSFVGEIVARPRGVRVLDAAGESRRVVAAGFQHFR